MDIDFEDMLRDPSDEFVDSMYKNYVWDLIDNK
jgi:hypothetical protein